VYDTDDGDGDDELKVHSNMCVHECAPRDRLAKLASELNSNIVQHHWPAPLASTINTTGQHHWAAPLASSTDVKYWVGCMIQMMVMGMMNSKYIRPCTCMSVHAAQ
jgi:hypothetical protein